MQLVMQGSAAKIRATFFGPDGEAADPTDPTVTIVRDSDGVEAVSDGATVAEAEEGVVSYTLDPADAPTVDLLTATFEDGATSVIVQVGVVGAFTCSLEAISAAIVAAGGTAPTTPVLRARRTEAEAKLEHVCNVALRPSYARETLVGDGSHELLLSRPRPLSIISAILGDEDVAAELRLSSDGCVLREDAVFARSSELDIAYAHGWASPPEIAKRAVIALASFYDASIAGDDDRVTRYREAEQEAWLTVAGEGNAETSIPEVNTAIRDLRYAAVA